MRIGGTDLGLLGDDGLLALRRERIGVLGRSPMLVGALSVQENVELPSASPDARWPPPNWPSCWSAPG